MSKINEIYEFDNDKKVWKRPDAEPFAYADGIEGKLMEILRKVKDKSVFSPELQSCQNDWPTTYYFSPARANILRPFEDKILKNASVLELGAGCGAISRYLGETAREVTAVEGAEDRAAIARERCSDLNNVTVIVDRIQNLPENLGKYDVVTLIGVLEYSGRFGMKPEELLNKAKSYLKDNGMLILAIENKLGMKYLAGVPEDHLGTSWIGVVNAYEANGVATWSRKELVNILKKAGYEYIEQFIPLPDYKLPLTIITQEGINAANENIVDLSPFLAGSYRIYELPPLFNKQEANMSIYKAGLMADMADSLCFIAKARPESPNAYQKGTLVEHYGNIAHMNNIYAKKMRLINNNDNIYIERKSFFPQQNTDNFYHVIEDEPYYKGKRLGDLARKAIMRPGWTITEFAESLRPWVEYILDHKTENDEIDGKYLDFIPFNAIISEDRTLQPFDLEWRSRKPINIYYLILRGLIHTITSIQPVAKPSPKLNLSLKNFSKAFFDYFKLDFNYEHLKNLWEGETIDSYHKNNKPLDTIFNKMPRTSIENIGLYLAFDDLCRSLGIHPIKLKEYIDKLNNDLETQKKTIEVMRKFIDKIHGHIKKG